MHYNVSYLNGLSIVSVAERLGLTLHGRGNRRLMLCPWHDDHHPSLILYDKSDKRGFWCPVCGKRGSVIDFVMQHEQMDFRAACAWLADFSNSPNAYSSTSNDTVPSPCGRGAGVELPRGEEASFVPLDFVTAHVTVANGLSRCLAHFFDPDTVQCVTRMYKLGAYSVEREGDETFFPSIDWQGRVHNIKVQHYCCDPSSPSFCHTQHGKVYWLTRHLHTQGIVPADAQLDTACLFGEQLLPQHPSAKVALVESPKNAVVGAALFPDLVWVATGNKTLRPDLLTVLRGRRVLVYPDRDAIADWTAQLAPLASMADFSISTFCEDCAPADAPKFDIADAILGCYRY